MIKIESKEIITVSVIDFIEILDGNISMANRHASFPVKAYNINGEFLGMENVVITNEEYDAWSSDDYIETIVLSRLGMTKQEPIAPVDPVTPDPVDPVNPDPVDPIDSGTSGTSGTGSENI
jgi:hypothetical protein